MRPILMRHAKTNKDQWVESMKLFRCALILNSTRKKKNASAKLF